MKPESDSNHWQDTNNATPEEAGAHQSIIEWEASEYIHHQKGVGWYVVFAFTVLAFVLVAALVQNWLFVVLIAVMAVALAIYAARPPVQVHYALLTDGLQIDKRHYTYEDFRSFGVVADGGLFSVTLIPTKRFMPAVSMYFAEADGERIVDILGGQLPLEKIDHDLIDRLMRKIRF